MPRRVPKRALVLTGALALLVGLAFLVARPPVPDPATNPSAGVRGGSLAQAAGLQITYRRDVTDLPADPGTVLREGDGLRFVYRGQHARYLELRARDGDRPPATIFPVDRGAAQLVRPGQPLPARLIVGPGGGRLVITALLSDRPWPAGAPPDGDSQTVDLSFAKE